MKTLWPVAVLPAVGSSQAQDLRAGGYTFRIAPGALEIGELAWLIHGDRKTVYVYRAGRSGPEIQTGILTLAREGPVAGFELDLSRIWAGL